MDLRKLQYFVGIVDAGSLHRASERLRVAQPALSKSIRSLENLLGVQLLIRHSKGVETTEEGATLYHHASEMLTAWKAAEADVRERARELSGTVSIGAPPTLAQCLFGQLGADVKKVYPRLRLEFFEGVGYHLWSKLHSEQLDIGVIGNTEGSDSIITELVAFEDVFVLSLRDSKPPRDIESLEALVGVPLVVTTRAPTGRSWFEEMTRSSGLPFEIKYRVESPQVSKDLVQRGLGSAILPRSGVLEHQRSGRFLVTRIVPVRLPRILATRKSRYNHPSVAFTRNLLRQQLRQLEDGTLRQRDLAS